MPLPGEPSRVAWNIRNGIKQWVQLCCVPARSLRRWHSESCQPSGSLDFTIIKGGDGTDSFQGPSSAVIIWMHEMSQFFAFILTYRFIFELLSLVLKALYESFLTPFCKTVILSCHIHLQTQAFLPIHPIPLSSQAKPQAIINILFKNCTFPWQLPWVTAGCNILILHT